MRFLENIEAERERIQKCISKYGWTSDHNLDWYIDSIIDSDAKPIFVEFDDGTGILTHKYEDKWRIWSDPLSETTTAVKKISEFAKFVLAEDINPALKDGISSIAKKQSILKCGVKEVWCDDVSDNIYPELKKDSSLKLNDIYYNLFWPVLDMDKYDLILPGGHFKEIRNSRNKFYREHKVEILKTNELSKKDLLKIVDDWVNKMTKKQKGDVYDLKYRNAVLNGFKAFLTSRVMVVDGRSVGFNAGYEVPNMPERFTGIIGIHDYSFKDLGTILWLEDLEWIKKNTNYKVYDMQGSDDGGLKQKLKFGAVIERKTDTFSITH